MTKRELRAEVARLQAENAALRAQRANHAFPVSAVPNGWYNTAATAATALPVIYDMTAQPLKIEGMVNMTTGCAAPPPPILTFNLPAGG